MSLEAAIQLLDGRFVKVADQTGWSRWLPGLRTLREYQVAWLRHDIVAGLVLTTMLVPVGIAYAVASFRCLLNGCSGPVGFWCWAGFLAGARTPPSWDAPRRQGLP